jgi:hypothetical protein
MSLGQALHGLSRLCAGHGAKLGGESPLQAELRRSVSLSKGVHREVESEGSRRQSKAVTNRNRIQGSTIQAIWQTTDTLFSMRDTLL